jgi:cytochrome c-type biogenesis protein CcmH
VVSRARLAAVSLIAAALLAAPAAVFAVPARTTLPDVEDEVMCPVCGTPLNLAQAPQADRERAFIRYLIARGATKQQIKRRLVAQYGPQVLAAPPAAGFDLAAYLVPILLGTAALALAVAGLLRWRSRRPADLGSPAPLTPGDARRLDADLARDEG